MQLVEQEDVVGDPVLPDLLAVVPGVAVRNARGIAVDRDRASPPWPARHLEEPERRVPREVRATDLTRLAGPVRGEDVRQEPARRERIDDLDRPDRLELEACGPSSKRPFGVPRRGPIAESPVDRPLRGDQDAGHVAARRRAIEIELDHLAQRPAPGMRRPDPDGGHRVDRDLGATRQRELARERSERADDLVAVKSANGPFEVHRVAAGFRLGVGIARPDVERRAERLEPGGAHRAGSPGSSGARRDDTRSRRPARAATLPR